MYSMQCKSLLIIVSAKRIHVNVIHTFYSRYEFHWLGFTEERSHICFVKEKLHLKRLIPKRCASLNHTENMSYKCQWTEPLHIYKLYNYKPPQHISACFWYFSNARETTRDRSNISTEIRNNATQLVKTFSEHNVRKSSLFLQHRF